jgi:hypothetical protein
MSDKFKAIDALLAWKEQTAMVQKGQHGKLDLADIIKVRISHEIRLDEDGQESR